MFEINELDTDYRVLPKIRQRLIKGQNLNIVFPKAWNKHDEDSKKLQTA
jgi:hypothetical protein